MGSYENPAIITDRSNEILAEGINNMSNILSQYASTVAANNKAKALELKEVDAQIDKVKLWQMGAEAQQMEKFGKGNPDFMEKIKPMVSANLQKQGEAQIKLLKSKDRNEKNALIQEISRLETQLKKNAESVQSVIMDVQAAAENPNSVYLSSANYNPTEIFTGLNVLGSGQPGDIAVVEGENGTWDIIATAKDGPGGTTKPVSFNTGWYANPNNGNVAKKADIVDKTVNSILKSVNVNGKYNENDFIKDRIETSVPDKDASGKVIRETKGIESITILDTKKYDKATKDAIAPAVAEVFGQGARAVDKQAAYDAIAGPEDPPTYEMFVSLTKEAGRTEEERDKMLQGMMLRSVEAKKQENWKKQFLSKEENGNIVFYNSERFDPYKIVSQEEAHNPTEAEKKYKAVKGILEGLKPGGEYMIEGAKGDEYIKMESDGSYSYYAPDQKTGVVMKKGGKRYSLEQIIQIVAGTR